MQYLFQYILLILQAHMLRAIFLFISYLSSFSWAMTQVDTSKLFYAKNFNSAAFVELGSNIIQVNDNAGMNIDFSANWLVEHKYYLGAAYSQLANVETIFSAEKLASSGPLVFNQETTIKYQTAGIRLGYILLEDQKVISISPDLTAGWTGINLIIKDHEQKINGAYLSPALKSVFNISDYLRVGLSVNYRVFVFKTHDSTTDRGAPYASIFSSKALTGWGGGLFLRIGKF